MILEFKVLDVEVLGWCGYTWSAVFDVLPNYSEIPLVEKLTFNSRAIALVGILVVSMPTLCSLKTCNICGIVLCDKTAHFRVASLRHTCAIIMLSKQHLDMPHL